jgi:polyisoprenoid-binding protein YceI
VNRIIVTMGCTLALATAALSVQAEPVTYNIDPAHTYPAFETDHMGGVSIWRGKFTRTTGKIVYDAQAKAGTVDVSVEAASVDLGHEKLEAHVRTADFLDVEKFPLATYKGKFSKFNGATPTEVTGELTLHGVTKPLTLSISQFLCKVHPMNKKEICGADASATFSRKDFGVGFGEQNGFKMAVKLLISVEAIKAE